MHLYFSLKLIQYISRLQGVEDEGTFSQLRASLGEAARASNLGVNIDFVYKLASA